MDDDLPSPGSQPVGQLPAAQNGTNNVSTPDIPPQFISDVPDAQLGEMDKLSKLPSESTRRPSVLRSPNARLPTYDGVPSDRRPSVQFMPQVNVDGGERSTSRNPLRDASARRLSSPPPPNQFHSRVAFDTFDNRDAPNLSLTLSRKHKNYAYSKRSRTFLCGTDVNEYSDTALEWLIDELVDDGDEIVCLRVVEKDSKEARDWAAPYMTREGRERGYRAEAQRMLERIQEKNSDDRHINLILEFSIGKVHETIQHMIRVYEPAMLVVGTRGKSLSGFQGLMPGSISKYCLQHSPVPVIVVRPSSKRDKKKRKRMRDPTRRGYRDILDKSEDVAAGGHWLDERNRHSVNVAIDQGQIDAEEEARRVAEAVGYRPGSASTACTDGAPLSKTMSARSEMSTRSARSSSMGSYTSDWADDPRSPVGNLLKSPEMPDLDSPSGSDDDSSDDDGYEQVPAYILQQEEALAKARERAIKAEEEEKEALVERTQREEEIAQSKKARLERQSQKASKTDTSNQGAAAVLGLLDDLRAQERKKR